MIMSLQHICAGNVLHSQNGSFVGCVLHSHGDVKVKTLGRDNLGLGRARDLWFGIYIQYTWGCELVHLYGFLSVCC